MPFGERLRGSFLRAQNRSVSLRVSLAHPVQILFLAEITKAKEHLSFPR